MGAVKAAVAISLALAGASASAESLSVGLARMLVEHNLMKAVDNDVASAKEQIGIEKSGWLPRVGIRANAGSQHVSRDTPTTATPNGNYNPRETTLTANQLIWDFGITNASIARAEQNLTKEDLERSAQRTNLVLAGIEAHLKLLRAQITLDYSKQSEEHIKRQTQLENARIESGKGLTTDLLQAKVQLAGAQARRVAAEGTLATSTNRYKAVFGDDKVPAGRLETVKESGQAVPKSLDEALDLVATNNPDVLAAQARAELKTAERDATKAKEYMPRIDMQAETGRKDEPDGQLGWRRDNKIGIHANWNFDLGMRASHAVDSASYAAASEAEKASYTAVQAREEARNAWSDLNTARQRLEFLNDQVEIAKRFLELARKERELGRRTLLDVLQGEVNLINAQSDAASAETDVVLASFRVLRAVGRLDPAQVVAMARK